MSHKSLTSQCHMLSLTLTTTGAHCSNSYTFCRLPSFQLWVQFNKSMRILEHLKIQLGCCVIPDVWQHSAHSNLLWHYQLNMTLMAPVLPAAAAVSKPVMMSFSEKPKRWVMRGSQLIFFSSKRSRHVGYCTNKDRGCSCSSKVLRTTTRYQGYCSAY